MANSLILQHPKRSVGKQESAKWNIGSRPFFFSHRWSVRVKLRRQAVLNTVPFQHLSNVTELIKNNAPYLCIGQGAVDP